MTDVYQPGLAVCDLDEFKKKWGNNWMKPIEDFIRASPEFPDDSNMARRIGELIADLQMALRNPY